MTDLILDLFAGGGGASTGIEAALGRPVDVAINHNPEAIAMHLANHPGTRHYCENVWDVDPRKATGGRPVGLAWFSPDCTFHSKARGGKPFRDRNRARRIRGLAWIVIRWAKAVRPRVIALENVEEFSDWGPLTEDGKPCPLRRGLTFRRWVSQLQNLGYELDMRELRACDYGSPTIRKRLFIIARCDGRPIVWPAPAHGLGLLPYHTAAECIDWSIPCPSIFERKRPLAKNTLRRIARGIQRYVIDAAEPFIVPVAHAGDDRAHSVNEPFRTVTGAHRGEHALITPFVTEYANGSNQRNMPADEPLRTQCAQVKGGHFALVAPTMVHVGNGEREGQAPRALDLQKPLNTQPASNKFGLVAAFLAKHYGGVVGHEVDRPIGTVTSSDHHSIVTSHLLKLKGTCRDGQPVTESLHTIGASGTHFAEVRAFLINYYSEGSGKTGAPVNRPIPTIPTKDRIGLVTIHDIDYQIVDIGMRMLTSRELFRAQGFADSYIIDPMFHGKPLTKTMQVRLCGNSVCPQVAQALVLANCAELAQAAAA